MLGTGQRFGQADTEVAWNIDKMEYEVRQFVGQG
jgi:hypothetical protein